MSRRLLAIYTAAMLVASALIWNRALIGAEAPEPMLAAAELPTFPAILVECNRGRVVALVSAHGRNRVVCQSIGGAQ